MLRVRPQFKFTTTNEVSARNLNRGHGQKFRNGIAHNGGLTQLGGNPMGSVYRAKLSNFGCLLLNDAPPNVNLNKSNEDPRKRATLYSRLNFSTYKHQSAPLKKIEKLKMTSHWKN